MVPLDSIGRTLLIAAVFFCACSEDSLRSLQNNTEQFSQNAAAKIDVLWVIDNSDSMGDEQSALGRSFEAFITTLVASSVDYHIGAISTDPNDAGRLHEGASEISFITPTTIAPAAVFLENVSVGTRGSPLERGFETMTLALGVGPEWIVGTPPSPPNPGFLRDDAALFVIAVSDEDDESFGPVAYYQRVVESYKGAGN
ncbi:MAG: hypothetical protein AAFY60_10635, partial [Myxococcota bacterium]